MGCMGAGCVIIGVLGLLNLAGKTHCCQNYYVAVVSFEHHLLVACVNVCMYMHTVFSF